MSSSIADVLRTLHPRRVEIEELERDFLELIKKYDVRGRKKNYSQSLSDALARKIVVELSHPFPGIMAGETRAGGRAGPIKVDVRFRDDYGMRLGISIKTINFRDLTTRRYTKNIKRNDKELRSEASDLHQYQPFAVLVGLVLLPEEARSDGRSGRSSLMHAMDTFRRRVGRADPNGDKECFELLFVGTYALEEDRFGEVRLHDAAFYKGDEQLPPELGWDDFLECTCVAYEERHRVPVKRRAPKAAPQTG